MDPGGPPPVVSGSKQPRAPSRCARKRLPRSTKRGPHRWFPVDAKGRARPCLIPRTQEQVSYSQTMPDDPKDDSFAALFEQSGRAAPRARRPRPGDVVQATVVQVGKEAVFVELEGRQQAFVEAGDLRDPEGKIGVA